MNLFKNYSPQTLRTAIEIELQKAGSTVVAAKIALKRLEEDPEYYTKMQKALGDMRPGHKYVRRVPKSTGKGFNYFYSQGEYDQFRKEQQKGWLSKIAEFFGFKDTQQAMQKVDSDYKSHDIAKKYNLTWDGWKDHVSEYFNHKDKWDNLFSGKKERKPATPKKDKKPAPAKDKKPSVSGKNLQLSVMRELYNIYGKKEETPDIKGKSLKEMSLDELKKERDSLTLKALKIFPNSPLQLKVREKIDKIWEEIKSKELPAAVDKSFPDFVDKLKGKQEEKNNQRLEPSANFEPTTKKQRTIDNLPESMQEHVRISVKNSIDYHGGDIKKVIESIQKIIDANEGKVENSTYPEQLDYAKKLLEDGKIKEKETSAQKKADIKISKAINAVTPETRAEAEREIMGIPEPPKTIETPVIEFSPKETEFVIPFLRADNTKFTAKDYTGAIPKDIYLVSDKNILTEKKPAYIPDVDESYLRYNHNLLPIYKMSEDKYVVQVNKGVPVQTGTYSTSFDKSKAYVVVNRDVLAAMHDYYLKKAKVTMKNENERLKKETGYSRLKGKSVRMMPENKMSYAQMDFIEGFIGKSEKAGETRKKTWELYNEIRQDMKQKTEDMEIQIEEYYNTHAKGRETAYGDAGLKDNLLNDYGVKVKRQNGAEISDAEISAIQGALTDVYQIFGNRSEMAKKFGLKISHSGDVLMHARKASGLFCPSMKAIGVTAKYGEKGTGFILAHEFGHFMDYYVGQQSDRHYISDNPDSEAGQIAAVFRKNMKSAQKSVYQNRTCECFARAMEQYWAIKTNNKEIIAEWDTSNHPTEEKFKEKLMPLIDNFFQNNESMLKAFYKNILYKFKGRMIKVKK
jgi:predicted DNA-binding WGR domain protein